ncbi:SagB/ThcOx family dehydrogenase [Crossiella sp. SN42]|uniref:SagB/ThcOx family dehydrogenase n=1 Tax=Crossiella sp. SN42 TaxID=2944808 RepID=UPI00207D026E|nr:SagB/ThcOx family dehydrogenase [Crossiella sp. SN42]MCO1574611.1 SagB/ThcOx family dehydrogenase [Crossiella sp. SN42]
MSDQIVVDSANLVDVVYSGGGLPGAGDPAEDYFEASKLYLSSAQWDVPGAQALERSAALRTMTTRAGRRYGSRPALALAEPEPLAADLVTVLTGRRSAMSFGAGPVGLPVLAGLLRHSYGISGQEGERPLRPTPSGGALYPLDVFVIAQRVPGLTANGLYHFDPFRNVLADLGAVSPTALGECLNPPGLPPSASVTLVLSASFWRSRFKYGQRALRFALMEAGHLAQNILLLATAYGLAGRPVGGFLDAGLTALLPDHNGVDDAPLYALLIGTPGGPPAPAAPAG